MWQTVWIRDSMNTLHFRTRCISEPVTIHLIVILDIWQFQSTHLRDHSARHILLCVIKQMMCDFVFDVKGIRVQQLEWYKGKQSKCVNLSGEFCSDEINECLSNPCLNNGTCGDDVNGFTCTCDPKWTGVTCQVRDACSEVSCANGGTCFNVNNTFVCKCPQGFAGKSMETNHDDHHH